MPWDELKHDLSTLKAVFKEDGAPLWQVTGTNNEPFHAHPAFLDAARKDGRLADLVSGTDQALRTALRDLRVTLDRHLAAVPEARTALGLAGDRFPDLDDRIALLRYHDTARSLPAAANPVIATAATAFADRQNAATVHDFTQLHLFFLSAVASFGLPYDAHTYPGRVDAIHALAVGSPAAATARRNQLGTEADWRSHQAGFALVAYAEAARLNFGTRNALAGHALKHVLLSRPQVPADQAGVERLVAAYLKDARDNLTGTAQGTVTSALSQNGTSRTYLFGVLNKQATMVAVDATGDAWISTYYGPDRT